MKASLWNILNKKSLWSKSGNWYKTRFEEPQKVLIYWKLSILDCNAKILRPKFIPLKMQPLPTTRRMLMCLSMCSVDESSNSMQKKIYVAFTLTILFSNVICFMTSLTYCLKFISINFNGAVFGFMIAVGLFGLIYTFIIAISMRHRMDGVITSLSTIYNCSEYNHWKFECSFSIFIKKWI